MKIEYYCLGCAVFVFCSCENNYNEQQINDCSNVPHFIEDNFKGFSEQDLKEMEMLIKPIDTTSLKNKLSQDREKIIGLFNRAESHKKNNYNFIFQKV